MPTLRQAIADRLEQALKARKARLRSTVRLTPAALRARYGGVLDFASAGVIARASWLRTAQWLERLMADSER